MQGLGHTILECLIFKRNFQTHFQSACTIFVFSLNGIQEADTNFTYSSAFDVVIIFYLIPANRCVVIFYYNFNLYLSMASDAEHQVMCLLQATFMYLHW